MGRAAFDTRRKFSYNIIRKFCSLRGDALVRGEKGRPRPIRAEIFRASLLLLVVTLALALGVTLYLTLRQERAALDANLMNSAQIVAQVPAVPRALERGEAGAELWDFLDEAVRRVSDIDVVVVADAQGIQYYYPDRSYVGKPYAGTDQARILAGEGPFTSNDTGVSGAERCAYAPVTGEEGALLGFVVVGINLRSLSRIVWHTVFQYLSIALVVVGLGALVSARLSSQIKGTLMGYEPDVFLHLFHQREDILEALEEGVLAVDAAGRIMYLNQAAADLFGADRDGAPGRPLHEVLPSSTLDRVARTGKPEYNVHLESLRHVRVVADRMPVRENGRIVGAVAIFRNRTELSRMAEDLTGVRHMVEAMRAYTHEFMNKLHVILGLLQIGQPEKAEHYILEITRTQQQAVGQIMNKIKDPAAAALLVGKASRCAELGIRLTLEAGSHLSGEERFLPSDAYVSLLGNLIENAVDALNHASRGEKEISVSIREEESDLLLCVEDTGPGIPAELRQTLFRRGATTKGEGRGTGLALVQDIVETYGGEIRVETEQNVGTSFFLSFRRYIQGGAETS